LRELSELTQTASAFRGLDRGLVTAAGQLLLSLGVADAPAQEAEEKLKIINKVAGIFATP
jgi:hypothetical protein